FPTRELAGFPGGFTRLGRKNGFPDADFRDLRSLKEEVGELLVDDRLDDPLDLGVPQFHLRLPLELRFGDLEAEDRRQSLAGVVALEALALLQVLVFLRVLDEGTCQTRIAPYEIGATLDRDDRVDEH